MPGPNEVELQLGTAQAEGNVRRLLDLIRQAKAEATQIGNQIGAGTATPAQMGQFRGLVATIAGAESAVNVLQTSGQAGASGGVTTAGTLAAAAASGASPFLSPQQMRSVPFADPSGATFGVQQMLPGLSAAALYGIGTAMGNGGMPMPAGVTNLSQHVVNTIQSAQSGGAVLGPNGAPLLAAAAGWSATPSPTVTNWPVGVTNAQSAATFAASGAGLSATAGALGGMADAAMLAGMGAYIGNIGQRIAQNQAQYAASRAAQQQVNIGRAAIGFGALSYVGSAVGLYAQQTATGEYDPMTAARIHGSAAGGIIGGVAGIAATPTAPGAGFATGMLAGAQVGGTAAEYAIAPFMRNRSMMLTLASTANRMGWSDAGDLINASTWDWSGWKGSQIEGPRSDTIGLMQLQEAISFYGKSPAERAFIRSGTYTGTDIISGPKIAQVFATAASAMMQSGEGPGAAWDPTVRLGWQYGLAAPGMMQMAAPVMAARSRFGRNAADLSLQFGAEAYGAYADAMGIADLSPREQRSLGRVQEAGYAAARAATVARGRGVALQAAAEQEMAAIAGLPEGGGSLAYAEAAQRRRDAVATAYGEYAGAAFELPLTRMEGAYRRATMMPFAPGFTYGMGLQMAGLRTQYAASLTGYREERRRRGELSVEEELGIESQIQGLQTANQQIIATMAEGGPNLMAGLAAGTPAGFGRFDAMQMAALRVRGTPIRRFGAMGGAQQAVQEAFVRGFGFGDMGPHSGTGGLSPGSGETTSLLRQILEELRRPRGSFVQPRFGAGDLAPSGGYVQTGGAAPFN